MRPQNKKRNKKRTSQRFAEVPDRPPDTLQREIYT